MRLHSLVLALVVSPALALGSVGCAHQSALQVKHPPTAARATANPPVTIAVTGTSKACTTGACGAYEHLVAVLQHTVLHFDYNAALLRPAAAHQLQIVADALRAVPDAQVRIAGNCDERGTEEYNLALGQQRAEAARAYLADLGIAADRMSTVSYGKERPVDVAHTEAAWARNRRDDLTPAMTPALYK